jgi:putative DNA primase/helicase
VSEDETTNGGTAFDDWTAEQRIAFFAELDKDQPRTAEEWIEYLLTLDPIEYDRQREAVAQRLDIRVSTLDDEVDKRRPKTKDGGRIILTVPEPWDSTVDGAGLLAAIQRLLEKYAILPDGAAVMLALWTLHSYALEAAEASPIVAVSSPEKRCGKTIVLEILQALSYRPLPAANITAAALFRTIESLTPTLLIDEADTFLRDNEELRGVLNSGHRRATAVIIRTTGENFEPKTFSTWCPKAIALIGKLPSTLEDRSIVVVMKRKSRSERVERIRYSALAGETAELQQKAVRWTADQLPVLRQADPDVPDSLNDRAADCWRPLLAIADAAGGDWPKLARKAALMLSSKERDPGIGVELLSDIRDIFDTQNTDKLSSEKLVEELGKLEDRPWPEWGKSGKPMSKSQLSRQLSRFDIVSKTIRLLSATAKGYERSQFDDAFARYLCSQNVTPSQPTPSADCDGIPKRHTESLLRFEKTSQPTSSKDCDGVTFSHPRNGDEDLL